MKVLTDDNLSSYANIPISPLIDSKNYKLVDIKHIKISSKEVDLVLLYQKSLVLMNFILV